MHGGLSVQASEFAPADFRRVLGHFPTGVVAITAFDDGPVGVAVGSFTSISLDPPLVGFFISDSSSTWPRINRAGSFAVNILTEAQDELCRLFGVKGAQRFAELDWTPGHCSAPLLAGALAWIECDIADQVELGDHMLVVGAVRRLSAADGGSPLVFFRSDYGRLAGPPSDLTALEVCRA
jgi:flavin reductase (DIM6/NTAB) family NADH-FMN oxidoreductase RutF